MKLLYCGTAAYEGIPAPFCQCDACRNARQNGGKDIRYRTQMLIDNDLVIDFPPDSFHNFIRYNIDYLKVKYLLITHSHSDHLYSEDIGIRRKGAAQIKGDLPLHIYSGESGIRDIENKIGKNLVDTAQIYLHELTPWATFSAGRYRITAIPAKHDVHSSPFLFIIEKDGKAIFYANDTGPLTEEECKRIAGLGVKIDVFSSDCTMCENQESPSHCMLKDVVTTEKLLKKHGCLKNSSRTVITHFSHNSYVSHERLEQAAAPYGFTVAYDGLTIEI